jgi:hypothetical protein
MIRHVKTAMSKRFLSDGHNGYCILACEPRVWDKQYVVNITAYIIELLYSVRV